MNWKNYWIALQTLVIKEVLRFARIWMQTILPPAITTVLYLLIFGELLGQRLGNMDGYSYTDFIIPGIIMMSIITNSYANVVSSFYSTKFQRHIEELLVSPLPNVLILLGYVLGGVARGLLVGVVVTLVTLFFTDLQINNFPLTIFVALLTSILFSLAGFINAVFAKSFDDISIIPTFVLTPLTYLGGIFYSITLLPEFWQTASLFNPIFYMVNAFRYAILGVSDVSMSSAFLIIGFFILVLFSASMSLLNRGVGIKS
ncbi:MAG: ABC transporter permease [Gammaproteobacteria bacterium]|nr:ABC transporter permease [Gammaproteobacteria bacterium]